MTGNRISDMPDIGRILPDGAIVPVVSGGLNYSFDLSHELAADAVNPLQFGAVGDGTTNDTAAINEALEYAASIGGEVEIPGGYIFAIYTNIYYLNGLRGLVGRGGVIKLMADCGLLVRGVNLGVAENVKHGRVEGLFIDCNDQPVHWGIYADCPSYFAIRNNILYNATGASMGARGLIRVTAASDSGEDASDIEITGNIILSDPGVSSADPPNVLAGIEIGADIDLGGLDALTYWKTNFSSPAPAWTVKNVLIANNLINGCYYGIALVACTRITLGTNYCLFNERGYSVQNGVTDFAIDGGVIYECISSAVHVAFGSKRGRVGGGLFIRTIRGVGEGLLQAYLGCEVDFDGVTIHSEGTNQYAIYIGPMCSKSKARNIDINGTVSKGYVVVESEWERPFSGTPAWQRVGTDGPPSTASVANAALANIILENITINGSSAKVGIGITQASTDAITGLVMKNITLIGTAYSKHLGIHEDTSGSCSGAVLANNIFDPSVTAANFTLPRGRAHFADWHGNTGLDTEIQGSATSDLGSIADGDMGAVSVTVTGAALGDYVTAVASSTALETGLSLTGVVTATDTAEARVGNLSGSAVDRASATYYITVRKRLF